MPKDPITTIQLKTSTRERLKDEGKKGESYDAAVLTKRFLCMEPLLIERSVFSHVAKNVAPEKMD